MKKIFDNDMLAESGISGAIVRLSGDAAKAFGAWKREGECEHENISDRRQLFFRKSFCNAGGRGA